MDQATPTNPLSLESPHLNKTKFGRSTEKDGNETNTTHYTGTLLFSTRWRGWGAGGLTHVSFLVERWVIFFYKYDKIGG